MSGTIENDFPSWLDRHLAERDWEVSDLARQAGISASIIFRWRKNYRPNITNARAIARAFGVPLLEVLVAAGQITPEEARADVSLPPSINDLDTIELTRELHRRAEAAQNRLDREVHGLLGRDERSTPPAKFLEHLIARAGRTSDPETRRSTLDYDALHRAYEKHGPRLAEADERVDQARQRIYRDTPPPPTTDELPPEPEGLSEPTFTPGTDFVLDAGHGRHVTLRLVHVDPSEQEPDHGPPDQDRSNTRGHKT